MSLLTQKELSKYSLTKALSELSSAVTGLEKFISYAKAVKEAATAAQESAGPLRVEITNAREVGGDKIMEVARNSDGTIARATVQQI